MAAFLSDFYLILDYGLVDHNPNSLTKAVLIVEWDYWYVIGLFRHYSFTTDHNVISFINVLFGFCQ